MPGGVAGTVFLLVLALAFGFGFGSLFYANLSEGQSIENLTVLPYLASPRSQKYTFGGGGRRLGAGAGGGGL